MAPDITELSEVGFNVIYLIYIIVIVTLMILKYKEIETSKKSPALRVLLGFFALMIGDIGHVGARLIVFFAPDTPNASAISGIGTLLETIGLIFLFGFWLDAWRLEFEHKPSPLYYILLSIGVIGLILFLFPQNDWTGEADYLWSVLRNIPWTVLGLGVSILILIDAKENKRMKIIGWSILLSLPFYLLVIFFGHIQPMLGMLMIVGTALFMVWEFQSLKYYFLPKTTKE